MKNEFIVECFLFVSKTNGVSFNIFEKVSCDPDFIHKGK